MYLVLVGRLLLPLSAVAVAVVGAVMALYQQFLARYSHLGFQALLLR
jgi:hypothetical protein